ncbi:MAG TPA: amylo-alpha-1,6-glucosidase [Candidatus Acidoferrales bacterium]|nr:amylo-alpha-1,6-glucosidase [Candidatus Acidoferrales bacterium]
MAPVPGERLLRFVGDKVRFQLRQASPVAPGRFQARLRTTLGRAAVRRREIIAAHAGGVALADASWRDLPMPRTAAGWEIELPLAEVGYFKAKAYLLDQNNWQIWPDGPDLGISVHPNFARTANTIYCAFTRLFGATRTLVSAVDAKLETQLKSLEALGYATLPPSGTFRDLIRQLPLVVNRLGCRIIHLLPVYPTPTVYARFGRFGSPYAALDLTAVDPALVEFDKRRTGIDQFCELTRAAHSLNARIFIDIVINHTGWGSSLQENHPEFFLKMPEGEFASPGAWGTTWADLVELEQHHVKLWDIIADSLLTWCRRGVDGFRCDAGYKIPTEAWQYIVARVQDEFPQALFFLEGLGGKWETTESLLTEGGLQWAYSELFQNYSGSEVAWYLDYANRQNERVGTYINYSETHDNNRLAAESSGRPGSPNAPAGNSAATAAGRAWSLLRNRLCALTSASGGFGFTCGVEWLATEKIDVHGNTGLNWNASNNIVPELAKLNALISNHPCFFDGARLTRLSPSDSPIYALLRESAEGADSVLVLVNTDAEQLHTLAVEVPAFGLDLLGQPLPTVTHDQNRTVFTLPPGTVYCLAPAEKPKGLSGEDYRRARALAAFAFEALNAILPIETADGLDWRWLAKQAGRSPKHFLAAAAEFGAGQGKRPLAELLVEAEARKTYPRVVTWAPIDARRITIVPAGHWLLIEDSAPFRATLEWSNPAAQLNDSLCVVHLQSTPAGNAHIACFAPRETPDDATLLVERYTEFSQNIAATIRFLPPTPQAVLRIPQPEDLVLLTNGRGGMARLCVDLGRINSKYDCALGANLHPSVPVDRHVLVKRLRVWVNADGFISALNLKNLAAFHIGPPAVWNFVANAGDGRTVEVELRTQMPANENTVVFQFSRPTEKLACGKQLPAGADVRLTVRADLEDRNFHSETKRNGGAEYHFSSHLQTLDNQIGFAFTPAGDRQLRVLANAGLYHPQPEWCENIPHPVEQTRGQVASGDAYSPGWFELPLPKGASVTLIATAEPGRGVRPDPASNQREPAPEADKKSSQDAWPAFAKQLDRAALQFVVRRDDFKTVIAGYPWFLDWGRDSLICARGLLAAGLVPEVKQILHTFAKFEQNGTLPNTINGNDVSNRDTSDAPLWLAIVCADLQDEKFFDEPVGNNRTIRHVLKSIAESYSNGTSNGIRMDANSALIWSPSHFTWMDTNYPAGTPREGYPVEIQVLWIRLLRLLERLGTGAEQRKWRELARRALASFEELFWLETQGWFADVLLANPGVRARDALVSDALRSNCLLAISLELVAGDQAKRCVEAAQHYLVVPGALRTLAPLRVSTPLPIWRGDHLLNNPAEPYWPRYEGDEDTRRKPAYHNGTAWTWTFPSFCEALAQAWDFSPVAVAAAKSYLGSAQRLMNEGCLGQLPEILDADAPHAQRGCDAQAWGVTETLRVWKRLNSGGSQAE